MDLMLEKLNAITYAWKAQFEDPQEGTGWEGITPGTPKPALPLVWTVQDGVLFLDGIWITPVRYIDTTRLDACAEQVQPVDFEVSLIDGSLDIIIIQEIGEYEIHAIERHC